MSRAALEESYSNASYYIYAPEGTIRLRIGEPSATLDALLKTHDAGTWAFITAWNPGSFHLPESENERNNRDLLERVLRMGYLVIPGEGVADDGTWQPEASLFIPGIPPSEALALGQFYRQMAIVAGRHGGAPELIWC